MSVYTNTEVLLPLLLLRYWCYYSEYRVELQPRKTLFKHCCINIYTKFPTVKTKEILC